MNEIGFITYQKIITEAIDRWRNEFKDLYQRKWHQKLKNI
jgi:hypothetical protein